MTSSIVEPFLPNVSSTEAFRRDVTRAGRELGFERISVVATPSRANCVKHTRVPPSDPNGIVPAWSDDALSLRDPLTSTIDPLQTGGSLLYFNDAPEGYHARLSARDLLGFDPFASTASRSGVPLFYTQETYLKTDLAETCPELSAHGYRTSADIWDEGAAFGYHHGIAIPVRTPEGTLVMYGDRTQDLGATRDETMRLAADLNLFAVFVAEAAFGSLFAAPRDAEAPNQLKNPTTQRRDPVEPVFKLTQRELECLKWTMEGKCAWTIGQILSITERTVVSHLSNACQKLDCDSKLGAVVKLMRLGILS